MLQLSEEELYKREEHDKDAIIKIFDALQITAYTILMVLN